MRLELELFREVAGHNGHGHSCQEPNAVVFKPDFHFSSSLYIKHNVDDHTEEFEAGQNDDNS